VPKAFPTLADVAELRVAIPLGAKDVARSHECRELP
jgi:hypothetical protein